MSGLYMPEPSVNKESTKLFTLPVCKNRHTNRWLKMLILATNYIIAIIQEFIHEDS